MFNTIKGFDLSILLFIQEHIKNPVLDTIVPFITTLGENGAIWLVAAVVLLFIPKYKKTGLLILCSLLFDLVAVELIIKPLVHRPRPFVEMQAINLLIDKPGSYSFPSGHSVSSFIAAGILYNSFKKYGILILCFALFMAFTRLYLFVHYPSDVLVGIILGLIISKAALKISNKLWVKN